MKKIIAGLWLIVLFGCGFPVRDQNERVLFVYGVESATYDKMIHGFRRSCDATITRLFIGEMSKGELEKEIHAIAPNVIVAAGVNSLVDVIGVSDIPIIYAYVIGAHEVLGDIPNIIGVSPIVPPSKRFEIILSVLPDAENIGLLFTENSAFMEKRVRETIAGSDVGLISKMVVDSDGIPGALREMEGKIDLIWMIPAGFIYQNGGLEKLLDFSFKTNTPVFTYTEKYAKAGALLSTSVDPGDIGRQIAMLSEEILAGANIEDMENPEPEKAIITINVRTVEAVSVDIEMAIVNRARLDKGFEQF